MSIYVKDDIPEDDDDSPDDNWRVYETRQTHLYPFKPVIDSITVNTNDDKDKPIEIITSLECTTTGDVDPKHISDVLCDKSVSQMATDYPSQINQVILPNDSCYDIVSPNNTAIATCHPKHMTVHSTQHRPVATDHCDRRLERA